MSSSPIYCEHANEMPAQCNCKDDCYCKEHSCKTIKMNTMIKKIIECHICDYKYIEGISCPNCVLQNETIMTDINVMKRCISVLEKTINKLKTQCLIPDATYDQEIVEYLVDLCFEILDSESDCILPGQIHEMGIYVEKLKKQKK